MSQNNSFSGTLPIQLSNLRRLKYLSFTSNNFSSIEIPPWLDSFHKLEHLYLDGNSFIGTIPPSIFNISSLLTLDPSFRVTCHPRSWTYLHCWLLIPVTTSFQVPCPPSTTHLHCKTLICSTTACPVPSLRICSGFFPTWKGFICHITRFQDKSHQFYLNANS